MIAKLVKYADLQENVKRQLPRVFVNWRYDTTVQTFEDWASKHAFYVVKSGMRLDERYTYCEPAYMAEEE